MRQHAEGHFRLRVGARLVAACAGVLLCAGAVRAQEGESRDELLERLRRLEQRVEELEGEAPAEGAGAQPAPDEAPAEEEEWRFEPEELPAEQQEQLEAKEASEGLVLELPWSAKLKLSGKLRVRGEYRDPADYRVPGTFGRPATADADDATDFALLRTRLRFDLQVIDPLRVLVELQDSRTFGDRLVAADVAEVHLHQGFMEVDLRPPLELPLALKAGRFEVPELGDSRLLSALDFSNVGRSWDGFQLTWEPAGFWVTAFAANIREGAVFSAERDENDDFWFSGIYASARMIEGHELDGYLFWRHLSDRVFTSERNTTRLGDRKDFTLGGRIKGELGPFGYSGEAAWQWGDQAGDRIRAWAAAVKAWLGVDLGEDSKLIFRAEYAYARGDRDPNDGKLQTFDPLFAFAHAYHGHQDLIAWSNVHAGMLGVQVNPGLPTLSLHMDWYVFWLDKRKDAWFDALKNPIRRDATGGAGSHIGTEVDLYVKYVLWERISFWGGYSHFFDGEFVRATGRSSDQGWAHLQAEVKF